MISCRDAKLKATESIPAIQGPFFHVNTVIVIIEMGKDFYGRITLKARGQS